MYQYQPDLFSLSESERIDSSNRLVLILDSLPDEKLIRILTQERKNKRDENPIRVMWYTLIGGFVYQVPTIAELIRHLQMNSGLRRLCGIETEAGVPTKDAYHRFLKKLIRHQDLIDEMFNELVEEMRECLPDLGEQLVVDSTSLRSWSRGKKEAKESSDPEAAWGVKTRKERDEKTGKLYERVKKWFGYSLHMIADAKHEIPLGYRITKANRHDSQECIPLVEELMEKHPDITPKNLIGDKAYDDGDIIEELITMYNIKAVIPLREMEDKKIDSSEIGEGDIVSKDGRLYCYEFKVGKDGERKTNRHQMDFWGYEEGRKSLKYRCPHATGKVKCSNFLGCSEGKGYGMTVRLSIKEDYRMHTAIPRYTKRWKRMYDTRASVERIFSRAKCHLKLDRIFLRRKAKITVHASLSLLVLLASQVAMAKRKRWDKLRCIVTQALAA